MLCTLLSFAQDESDCIQSDGSNVCLNPNADESSTTSSEEVERVLEDPGVPADDLTDDHESCDYWFVN